jgi:hypothetical protein
VFAGTPFTSVPSAVDREAAWSSDSRLPMELLSLGSSLGTPLTPSGDRGGAPLASVAAPNASAEGWTYERSLLMRLPFFSFAEVVPKMLCEECGTREFLVRRRKNQIKSIKKARPTRVPMTMAAMAPPEIELLLEVEDPEAVEFDDEDGKEEGVMMTVAPSKVDVISVVAVAAMEADDA